MAFSATFSTSCAFLGDFAAYTALKCGTEVRSTLPKCEKPETSLAETTFGSSALLGAELQGS